MKIVASSLTDFLMNAMSPDLNQTHSANSEWRHSKSYCQLSCFFQIGLWQRVSARHLGQESISHTENSKHAYFFLPTCQYFSAPSRGLRSAGPTFWNSLPLSVTSCSTIHTFKKQLKMHLFTYSWIVLDAPLIQWSPLTTFIYLVVLDFVWAYMYVIIIITRSVPVTMQLW